MLFRAHSLTGGIYVKVEVRCSEFRGDISLFKLGCFRKLFRAHSLTGGIYVKVEVRCSEFRGDISLFKLGCFRKLFRAHSLDKKKLKLNEMEKNEE
ncbi:hypothetical protein [Bathymodiolus platifrons methanotrophic gill symbiont]|uniref:hypothetical protein n=1 Tax=Bathymodiolus platifrons methanotrophic gill symbiont TaxID=113268 RepID=UPI001C8E446B|nr:hypothetical protein [Bathymodiolus platifrons methanotrophic gill symbiont]